MKKKNTVQNNWMKNFASCRMRKLSLCDCSRSSESALPRPVMPKAWLYYYPAIANYDQSGSSTLSHFFLLVRVSRT